MTTLLGIIIIVTCAQSFQPYRVMGDRFKRICGIWVECQGRNDSLRNKGKIEEMFERVAIARLNTVFLQVYRVAKNIENPTLL